MEGNESGELRNDLVRSHYDAQAAALAGSYEESRWHSSVTREFEYRQTARALRRALGERRYHRALEIGPGDGVWTPLIGERVRGSLHLVEQSREMLARAQERLRNQENLTFEHSDFMESHPPAQNDLIVAVRCFEYFPDKEAALGKMRELLAPGGRIVIVTKNAELLTLSPVRHKTLHSGQVSRAQMRHLASTARLTLQALYPAVLRWKAAYAPMRALFDKIHRMILYFSGVIPLPPLSTYAVESYVYVLTHV
jgi:trans-aconitate methyltransferase